MLAIKGYAVLLCFLVVCLNSCYSATIVLPESQKIDGTAENSISKSIHLIVPTDYSDSPSAEDLNVAGDFHLRKRRELSDWLIAPNTRWCGRGNTAGKYNHLGGASNVDKCCRRHDHCQLFIHGMSTKYDLFNYRPFTLSHCNCDRRFRTCLKMADNSDAKMVGKLFFNIVQTQCFILKAEKICVRRSTEGTCEKEETKHKAYIRDNMKF